MSVHNLARIAATSTSGRETGVTMVPRPQSVLAAEGVLISETRSRRKVPVSFCSAMSPVCEHQTAGASSVLRKIPVEMWSKILHEEQGFTVEDFKILCFVAPFFRSICQPLAYRTLDIRKVNLFYGYSFGIGWRKQELKTTLDLEQWKQDVACLIRAERRLRLVGDASSLPAFPNTMSIGVMPGHTIRNRSMQHPPTDKMVLSKIAHDAFLQLKCTLVRTLPLFTHLRRLELCSFPIDDGLLRAIASQPVLHELRLGSCSFSSSTFPISSIHLLECNKVSKAQAPAAFRLASSQHLEELRIENMDASAVLEGLRARPESESMLTELHRLTIVSASFRLNLLEMESLLSYVPALRQLDIGEASTIVPEGAQAMKSSTVPYLRQLSGPLSLARHVVPGRPVSNIRSGDDEYDWFMETWPSLQAHFYPLCLSAATAEGITTLHLPNSNVAPIWLLSRFVAETFPRLVDLKLPVGMIQDSTGVLGSCIRSISTPQWLLDVEGPFEEVEVEGMVTDIRDRVEHELMTRFDDPYHQTLDLDYKTRRVKSPAPTIPTSVSLSKIDVAQTLAERSSGIELDTAGEPSRLPEDYQEALVYFAQGWYPLPTGIETLSLSPGFFPTDSDDIFPSVEPPFTVEQSTCIAVVTTLGERYPNLGNVTLTGIVPDGYIYERIRGISNGTTSWTVRTTRES
ncbi:hypothetical protein EST38_g4612 [Candolleomyces aberdarensis]|uniref:F-box domain-containing protein n=1 Tax=Candolleomyces aberdarensis TaxID=2316362 RepID=A0A4Q2DQJ4_9AGAR|nr:hypothetical protein EST38_g4612 [Candolleomyces aberdarensis]